MQVIIAEKPSVAREIAAIVGATNRKDGFIEGNGYAVTWAFRRTVFKVSCLPHSFYGPPPVVIAGRGQKILIKPAYPAIIVHPPAPAGSGG